MHLALGQIPTTLGNVGENLKSIEKAIEEALNKATMKNATMNRVFHVEVTSHTPQNTSFHQKVIRETYAS